MGLLLVIHINEKLGIYGIIILAWHVGHQGWWFPWCGSIACIKQTTIIEEHAKNESTIKQQKQTIKTRQNATKSSANKRREQLLSRNTSRLGLTYKLSNPDYNKVGIFQIKRVRLNYKWKATKLAI